MALFIDRIHDFDLYLIEVEFLSKKYANLKGVVK